MNSNSVLQIKNVLLLIILISIQLFPQRDSSTLDQYNFLTDQIIRKTLTEKPGYKLLQELCDVGPRLSGSENSLRAIHWAEEKLKSFEVDRVWLQPVMVPHWERGSVETAEIINGKSLNILSLGGSISTPENGITANVIEVKNFTELKERQNEVKGKIVFFSRPLDEGLLNTFAGYGGAVDQRFYGAVEAAKYGAVAVLIRSITTKHDNVPHTGVMGYADSLQKIPAAAIGYLDSDYLHNALVENPDLKIKLNMDCKTFPDAQSYNVIAEIKGTEFPDEIIVVGSHFDSWDVGCGAHDDGAGCVQSME
ncbi:MAG TPA: M28 family peptidase, partial [Ignavibacteriaceae bacterium]